MVVFFIVIFSINKSFIGIDKECFSESYLCTDPTETML